MCRSAAARAGLLVLSLCAITNRNNNGKYNLFVSSFVSPIARTATINTRTVAIQTNTKLNVRSGPTNNDDGGSGIYYDADPSRMEQMMAAAGSLAKTEQPQPSTSTAGASRPPRKKRTKAISKDVVIIGSGLAGLSAALHIATTTEDRHITILDRENPDGQQQQTTAGSFAAAGMLAPQSERLPQGPLLNLCLESREMYPEFVEEVEGWARQSGSEGEKYLWKQGGGQDKDANGNAQKGKNELQPWEVGFTAAGGFLAPAFAGDSVATWAPPSQSGTARWLDAVQVRELEPQLHPDVVGGWWFPEDASVDARRLTCSLRAACVGAGVQFMCGPDCEATSLELSGGTCRGIRLADGRNLSPKSILVANGSWMRNLLPVPVVPHKGQSFSVRMPPDAPPILSRVLFAQDTYIVPKADGRIVVGATVEAGSFDPSVTPSGLMHCMSNACQLVPGLADLPMEETWAGLRPTTPDKGPILGSTPWDNLYLAGGYWRNGVLLAPKTGQLVGDLITGNLNEEDETLLSAFSWDRFTAPGGGEKLAADARYAASMHPVHRRSTGMGVSAAVGTELGFYSGAGDAKDERAKDRSSLFDEGVSDNEIDSFEKAAMLGKSDAGAFSFGEDVQKERARSSQSTASAEIVDEPITDAYTVGSSDEDDKNALQALYSQYRSQIEQVKKEAASSGDLSPAKDSAAIDAVTELTTTKTQSIDDSAAYDEKTYDGYQAILSQDWGSSEAELKEKMRKSRIKNRMKTSEIDESAIGAMSMEDFSVDATTSNDSNAETETVPLTSGDQTDLSSVYEQIKANKEAAVAEGVEMQEASPDARPDPGFRIYRVDADSGEKREVPPYTSPGRMEELIAKEQSKDEVNTDTSTTNESPVEVDVVAETALEVPVTESSSDDYSEETLDGYQAILKADWGASENELKEKMRKSRIQNRMKTSEIDESQIGAVQMESVESVAEQSANETMTSQTSERSERKPTAETILKLDQPDLSSIYEKIVSTKPTSSDQNDLSSVYEKIKANKEAVSAKGVEMEESSPDHRPDPGFRIYRVDADSGEKREVPPYTSPGQMEELIGKEKDTNNVSK